MSRRATRAAAVAVVLALGGACVACGGRGSDISPPAGAATGPVNLTSSCPTDVITEPHVVVDISGFAYCPPTLTVAAGVDLAWRNADLAPHTVTYDGPGGQQDSGSMAQGQVWATRFGVPGTYQYYCRFHPGMTGTIVVSATP